jgi:hypothetical protein
MRKLFILLFIGTFLISCSSDSSSKGSSNLSNTPTAKAEYDGNNFGIYKGVFTGSSGIITINIKNNGSLNAILVLDGTTYTFTTTETVTENQAINGLTFTSGNMSFDFKVNADGSNELVESLNFPGHPNAEISISKEYSDALVACYQGTYSGTSQGVFNFTISDGQVRGLAHSTSEPDTYTLQGDENNNAISGTYSIGAFSGTISGNSVSGNWQNTDPDYTGSGTWTGVRTL